MRGWAHGLDPRGRRVAVYFTMMLGDTKKSDLRVIDVVPSTAVKLPEG